MTRIRTGSASVLLAWALTASASPGPLTPDEIARAVQDLGNPSFETREAALQKLLKMGAEDPSGILESLTSDSADPEIQSRLHLLRERIPVEHLRRMVLSGEDSRIPGVLGKTFSQTVNDLFDAPTPQKLGHFHAWSQTHAPQLALIARAFLHHERAEFRNAALHLALLIREPSLAPDISPLLRDADASSRLPAFEMLAQQKHPAAREALPTFLAIKSFNVEEQTRIIEIAFQIETLETAERLVAARIEPETDPIVLTVMLDHVQSPAFRTTKNRALLRLLNTPRKGVQEWAACRILSLAGEPFVDPAAIECELAAGDSNIPAARAWLEKHKGDPAFLSEETR